jgi:proton glutamate symport protein
MARDRDFVSIRWVVAGILIGIVGGLWLNRAGGAESPLFGVVGLGADLFIRLLRMVIVPLVVASLITAAAGLDTRYLGRLGVITLVYYTATTLLAAGLGLVIVNLVDPGVGAALQGAQTPKEILEREPPTFADLLRNLIPANPIDALARTDMLQIISFSLIVGVALNIMGDRAQAVKSFVSEVLELSMVIVRWVLYLLPVGVALLLARAIGQAGWEVFAPLAKYMGAVLGGLAMHGLIVLPLLGVGVGRRAAVAVPVRHLECDADRA